MAGAIDFSDFVAHRSAALLRTAYLLTGEWATAEDLLQTTLTACWRRWSRIEGEPEPYVRAALVRTYVSWRRRRWNGESPSAQLPDIAGQGGTDAVDDRDELWRALRRLPRRRRAVVVLRYFDDLSETEVAAVLGVSVGTVKSQASKALAALRVDPGLSSTRHEAPAGSKAVR